MVKRQGVDVVAVRRIADEMRARMVGNIGHHPKPVYGGELLDWANALEAALRDHDHDQEKQNEQ